MRLGVFRFNTNIVLLCIFAIVSGLQAQNFERLDVVLPAGSSNGARSFSLELRAVSHGGQAATNPPVSANLAAYVREASAPKITEVAMDGESVEVSNVSGIPVDVSNWELESIDRFGTKTGRRSFGTNRILMPGGVVRWSSALPSQNPYPAFGYISRFFNSGYNDAGMFLLRDDGGKLIDQVILASTATRGKDVIPGRSYVTITGGTNQSWLRVGADSNESAAYWMAGAQSIGVWNQGLLTNWLGYRRAVELFPSNAVFVGAAWIGLVTVATGGDNVTVVATPQSGPVGLGQPLYLPELPQLVPSLASGSLEIAESGPLQPTTVEVFLPVIATSNVVVSILGDTNQFLLPTEVVIPTGSLSALIAVTNVNDLTADGDCPVKVTITSPGYKSASLTLTSLDDQTGVLRVILPDRVSENQGFGPFPGQVVLGAPAKSDLLVRLSAEFPLRVPSTVTVPKGRLQALFPYVVEDDFLINPTNKTLRVTARTGIWPVSVQDVAFSDNDYQAITLSNNPVVLEGKTLEVIARFRMPFEKAAILKASSYPNSFAFPTNFVIEAGVTSTNVPLAALDNSDVNGGGYYPICFSFDGGVSACTNVLMMDDEVSVRGVTLDLPPAAFSDTSFTRQIRVTGVSGSTQVTNATGTVGFGSIQGTSMEANGGTVFDVTNGLWSGALTVRGVGIGAYFPVKVVEVGVTSGPIDIVVGRELRIPVVDLAGVPGEDDVLVLQSATNSIPARLVQIDPKTSIVRRTLDLPRNATRIAVSQDGTSAVLASLQQTIQFIDLTAWTWISESDVDANPTGLVATAITFLPGESNKVVAFISAVSSPGTTARLTLFNSRVRGNQTALPSMGPAAAQMIPGSVLGECFIFGPALMARATNSAGTMILAAQNSGPSWSPPETGFILSGDRILTGTGDAYSAKTLGLLTYHAYPFNTPLPLVDLLPGQSFASVLSSIGFGLMAATNSSVLTSHRLPGDPMHPRRLVKWGTNGFTAMRFDQTGIVSWESPIIPTGSADLQLTASGPAEVPVLPPPFSVPYPTQWQIQVTNLGPSAAVAVRTRFGGSVNVIPYLAPNSGVSIGYSIPQGAIASVDETVDVTSQNVDPVSTNNAARVSFSVKADLPGPSRQLAMPMSHLVTTADRTRLLVATSRALGYETGGIAVINPNLGNIERLIPFHADIVRLVPSSDGLGLFTRQGAGILRHLSLADGTSQMSLSETNETFFSEAPVPGGSSDIVVATSRRILLVGPQGLKASYALPVASPRSVAFSGQVLWVSDSGYLTPLSVGPASISAAGAPLNRNVSNSGERFAADTNGLYFYSNFLSLTSLAVTPSPAPGLWLTEPTGGFVYGMEGRVVRRYSTPGLALVGEERILAGNQGFAFQDIVRWGGSGIAVRTWEGGLIMYTSSLIPDTGIGDLDVRLTSGSLVPGSTGAFTLTVTNYGPDPAPRVRLNLVASGAFSEIAAPSSEWVNSLSGLDGFIGTLAAYSSRTWSVTGRVGIGSASLTVKGIAGISDPQPANNSFTFATNLAWLNWTTVLSRVSAPLAVTNGIPFDLAFQFTNTGSVVASFISGSFPMSPGVELVSVVPGTYGNCCDTYFAFNYATNLGIGQSTTSRITARITKPGWHLFALQSVLPQLDQRDFPVYVPPSSGKTNYLALSIPQKSVVQWIGQRAQFLAAFGDFSSRLYLLNKDTLAPESEITMPGSPVKFTLTSDGRFAWILLADGRLCRLEIDTSAVDMIFNPGFNLWSPVGDFAAPNGSSTVLVTASDKVVVFDAGVPRPVEYSAYNWTGVSRSLIPLPDGRVALSSRNILRLMQINGSGVGGVTALDSLPGDDRPIRYQDFLVYPDGRIANLFSQTGTNSQIRSVDVETGVGISVSPGGVPWGGSPMTATAYGVPNGNLVWRATFPVPNSTFSSVVPMGTNGFLILGSEAWRVADSYVGSNVVDLSLGAVLVSRSLGTNDTFSGAVSLTNMGPWAASQTELRINHGPGLSLIAPTQSIGSVATIQLGEFIGTTNISLSFRALQPGSRAVELTAFTATVDTNLANNVVMLTNIVAPNPMVFLEDAVVTEGELSYPGLLPLSLSTPAPFSMSFPFRIELLTAQRDDLVSTNGSIMFAKGQSWATFSFISGDSTVEGAESFKLVILTNQESAFPTSAIVTIRDDDFPQLQFGLSSALEGSAGIRNVRIPVSLSVTSPVPTRVALNFSNGTATSGSDYLASPTILIYPPGVRTNFLEVPFVGDSVFEPVEVFSIVLNDFEGLYYSGTPLQFRILNDDTPPAPVVSIGMSGTNSAFLKVESQLGVTLRVQQNSGNLTGSWINVSSPVSSSGIDLFQIPLLPGTNQMFRVLGY